MLACCGAAVGAVAVGWWLVAGMLVLGALGVGALASARPGLGLFGASIQTVPEGIALTIDDGPDPASTPRLLAILDAAGVRATFFFLGDRVRRHPDLVCEVVRAGHDVGLHGLTHSAFLTWASPSAGEAWLREGVGALAAAGAPAVRFFRPPFGVVSPRLFSSARAAGLAVVWVSVRTGDGVPISAARLRKRLASAVSGDIVLIHEGNATTLQELPVALAAWTARTRVGSLAELIP